MWGDEILGGKGQELCKSPLTNETFIAYDFSKNGYKTFFNEDYLIGRDFKQKCLKRISEID